MKSCIIFTIKKIIIKQSIIINKNKFDVKKKIKLNIYIYVWINTNIQ